MTQYFATSWDAPPASLAQPEPVVVREQLGAAAVAQTAVLVGDRLGAVAVEVPADVVVGELLGAAVAEEQTAVAAGVQVGSVAVERQPGVAGASDELKFHAVAERFVGERVGSGPGG